MPIYEYRCQQCGNELEVMQKVSDPAPVKCEKCGAENSHERLVSRTSFQLKGGGWYSDLYSSSKKDSGGGSSGGSSSGGSSSGGASSGGSSSGGSSSGGSSGGSSSGGGSGGSSSGGSGSSSGGSSGASAA
ncbi:MAG: zinc ribbon domain-containing protein [Myxococcaceae bacterium]|nr:zinc ribbon domain-containing protein [Myxococcaceae bacterium]